LRRSPRKSALAVSVSASFARVVPNVLSRVKHSFDLGCDPAQVAACLGDLAAAHPGLRVPGTFDGFELAARAVIGQQITVRAARTLLGRLVREVGTPIDRASDGTSLLFPTAVRVAACEPAQIARLGMPSSRARTLVALAAAVARSEIDLGGGGAVEAAIAQLQASAGVGTWNATYSAITQLSSPGAA